MTSKSPLLRGAGMVAHSAGWGVECRNPSVKARRWRSRKANWKVACQGADIKNAPDHKKAATFGNPTSWEAAAHTPSGASRHLPQQEPGKGFPAAT